MYAAIVKEAGQAPVYGEFSNPPPTVGRSLIRVSAAAISHVTRNRASGAHYSARGGLPLIPGIDGTGLDAQGRRVYFLALERPYGAMAQWCLVDEEHRIVLPDQLSDEDAAAMAIPGMSSWAALVERAALRGGESVLINGATGASGRLAIQIAKHLGAGRVIATGRRPESFDALRTLGADVTIPLLQPAEELAQAFTHVFEQGVDIVLDYLWGASAEALLLAAAQAGAEGVPIRYVQIGAMSATNISLPSAVLRSSALQLMGSGIGSIPLPRLLQAVRGVLESAPSAGFQIATQSLPLLQVASAWAITDSDTRIVLRP